MSERELTQRETLLDKAENYAEMAEMLSERDPVRAERCDRHAAQLWFAARERYYSGSQDY